MTASYNFIMRNETLYCDLARRHPVHALRQWRFVSAKIPIQPRCYNIRKLLVANSGSRREGSTLHDNYPNIETNAELVHENGYSAALAGHGPTLPNHLRWIR